MSGSERNPKIEAIPAKIKAPVPFNFPIYFLQMYNMLLCTDK